MARVIIVCFLFILLSGCLARMAADVVTAPVKVVSKTADVLTTSQSESDEKRGRAIRKEEERIGKLSRERNKAQRECARNPESEACERVDELNDEIGR
jgi:predicted Holliday junction resolvase-like endonuclease